MATAALAKTNATPSGGGLAPMDLMTMATVIYKAGGSKAAKPEEVAMRILAGQEVGLKPVQACSSIMLVNGRAVIYGDAALALVRASGKLDAITETIEGTGDDRRAVCTSKRAGVGKAAGEERTTTFGVADAKAAKLWKKAGPWTDYPDRMLMFRARSWNLRDNFGDVLSGLGIFEEAQDIPTEATASDTTAAPAAIKSATPPAALACTETEAVFSAITMARREWLAARGLDPSDQKDKAEVTRQWGERMAAAGVKSARELDQAGAAELLRQLKAESFAQDVEAAGGPAAADATPGNEPAPEPAAAG